MHNSLPDKGLRPQNRNRKVAHQWIVAHGRLPCGMDMASAPEGQHSGPASSPSWSLPVRGEPVFCGADTIIGLRAKPALYDGYRSAP